MLENPLTFKMSNPFKSEFMREFIRKELEAENLRAEQRRQDAIHRIFLERCQQEADRIRHNRLLSDLEELENEDHRSMRSPQNEEGDNKKN